MNSATADHPTAGAPAVGSDPFCLVGARKEFGATLAVHDLDLAVEPGSVHALLGENGAGKSTAAQMLAGVHSLSAGQLHVDGDALTFASAQQAEQRGIYLIPQELLTYPALSVAENLFVARPRPRTRSGRIDRREMHARARAALDRLGATGTDPADLVGELPYSSRQLVVIARALMNQVRLLVMDEPTAALDEWESLRLLDVVRELRADGVAVLYVSHRMNEVLSIADVVTVMRDGRLVSSGPRADYDHDRLIEQMVGRAVQLVERTVSHATDEVALRVSGLSQTGRFEDVSFQVRRGEVLGIAGIVGSGRSELALAVFGRTRPTSGTVEVNGQEVVPGIRRSLTNGLGLVPEERQSQGLFLPLDVISNVSVISLTRLRSGRLLSQRKERRFAEEAMRRFSFKRALSEPVGSLSGGNQQKVLLARTLASSPEVIILDEPTRGVDVGARAEIYEVIDELAAAGTAIVVISSDISEVLLLSDRILVMQGGRLTAELTGSERTERRIGEAALMHHELEGAS